MLAESLTISPSFVCDKLASREASTLGHSWPYSCDYSESSSNSSPRGHRWWLCPIRWINYRSHISQFGDHNHTNFRPACHHDLSMHDASETSGSAWTLRLSSMMSGLQAAEISIAQNQLVFRFKCLMAILHFNVAASKTWNAYKTPKYELIVQNLQSRRLPRTVILNLNGQNAL